MTLGPQFEQLQLFDPGPKSNVPFRGRERDPLTPLAERKLVPYGGLDMVEFKMLMTPKEIRQDWQHNLGDQYEDESVDEFWERKADESHTRDVYGDELGSPYESLANSIARKGVQRPVHLGWDDNKPNTVLQGHHRLASAMEQAPDNVIPVTHHWNRVRVVED